MGVQIYLLQFFDFASGKERLIAKLDTVPDYGLTLSPHGKTILYSLPKPRNFDPMLVENFR